LKPNSKFVLLSGISGKFGVQADFPSLVAVKFKSSAFLHFLLYNLDSKHRFQIIDDDVAEFGKLTIMTVILSVAL